MPPWASAILREVCGLVLGVPAWLHGEKRFEGIDFEHFSAKEKESFSALLREVKKLLSTEIKMNGAPDWLVDLTNRKAQWRAEKTANPAKKQKEVVEGDGQLGAGSGAEAAPPQANLLAGAAAATEAAVGPALAGSGAEAAPPQANLLAGTAAAKEAGVAAGPALAGSGAETAPLQGDLLAAKDPSF